MSNLPTMQDALDAGDGALNYAVAFCKVKLNRLIAENGHSPHKLLEALEAAIEILSDKGENDMVSDYELQELLRLTCQLLTPSTMESMSLQATKDLVKEYHYAAQASVVRKMAAELLQHRANQADPANGTGQLWEGRAAVATLTRMKYTFHGGAEWKPPLGPVPSQFSGLAGQLQAGGNTPSLLNTYVRAGHVRHDGYFILSQDFHTKYGAIQKYPDLYALVP